MTHPKSDPFGWYRSARIIGCAELTPKSKIAHRSPLTKLHPCGNKSKLFNHLYNLASYRCHQLGDNFKHTSPENRHGTWKYIHRLRKEVASTQTTLLMGFHATFLGVSFKYSCTPEANMSPKEGPFAKRKGLSSKHKFTINIDPM